MKDRTEVNGVTVCELTVAQLDALLNQPEDYTATLLDRMLDRHMVTGGMLSASTGISEGELSAMKPSELTPIVDQFKEVNADFFEMARREVKRAEEMSKALGSNLGSAFAS